jgi:ankyrin repeat protein
MLRQFEIDDIFKSCQDGSLDASSMSTVPHMTSLRNINGESLLQVAIKKKHILLIQELLKFNFMSTSGDQRSTLNTAAETSECEIVSMVFDRIGDAAPSVTFSALMTSSKHGYSGVFRYLFSRSPQDRDRLNQLLPEACDHGHADIARELISAGADAHQYEVNDFARCFCRFRQEVPTDFLPGVNLDPMADVVDLLEETGIWLYRWHSDSWREAGTSGSLSFMNLFLSRKADSYMLQDLFEGACEFGHAHVIAPLLKFADDIQFKPHIRELLDTAFCGFLGSRINTDVIKEILRYDSAPAVGSSHLLMYAAIAGRGDIVKKLIGDGYYDVNNEYRYQTPLSCASDPAIIKQLLDAKADVNPAGCSSVLRAVSEQYQLESVKMLLSAGADINSL